MSHGYETSVVGKHRCGNQILKTIAGIVGRTLDCVETSAVWKLSEFGMLSIDPRAARKAGREKNCNNQHLVKPHIASPSHCAWRRLFVGEKDRGRTNLAVEAEIAL